MNDGTGGRRVNAADAANDIPAPTLDAPSQGAECEPAPETQDSAKFEESIVHELSTLIDDGRTYAQAEIAFQKTRAKLVGKSIGIALVCAIIALILLNIAFLALAVGLVIALAPLVTIWGAIAIVVGALMLLVALLGWIAMKQGKLLSGLFSSADEKAGPDEQA